MGSRQAKASHSMSQFDIETMRDFKQKHNKFGLLGLKDPSRAGDVTLPNTNEVLGPMW